MTKKYKVGVTVGRFQVSDLHYAHIKIIYDMMVAHEKVCIFLGVSSAMGTDKDPLDFESRKIMIEEQFPNVIVEPITDQRSDEEWSKNLDIRIKQLFPKQSVLICGGRDSFLDHYCGKYPTQEFPKINHFPGSEVRKKIGEKTLASSEFRKGQIYLTQKQYPRTFFTVDIACISPNGKTDMVLLGKKAKNDKLRFPGGFIDPTDESLFHAAKRELFEETNLDIDLKEFNFLTSVRINDWRYRGSKDGIMTNFLVCNDDPKQKTQAKDDLVAVEWCDINDKKLEEKITPSHLILLKTLKIHIQNKGNTVNA